MFICRLDIFVVARALLVCGLAASKYDSRYIHIALAISLPLFASCHIFLMVLATSSIMVLHIAPRFLVCISKSLHVFLEVCAVYLL